MSTHARQRRKITPHKARGSADHTARSGEKERRRLSVIAPPKEIDKPAKFEDTGDGASLFRDIDRQIHAALAPLTFGLSPISLYQAWLDWALHRAIAPGKQYRDLLKAFEKWARLRRYLIECGLKHEPAPTITPLPQDHRFHHPDWQKLSFSMMEQSFLLMQQWWHNATVGISGVSPRHERLVEFYSRQWLDMFAPSNFLATNPEAIERTLAEGGANLLRGYAHYLDDLTRTVTGKGPAGTEDFAVGGNLAVTPGEVIYRNDLIELIQYSPTTDKVKAEPILIVPAWIMKYYILDLSPHNSLVRYLVDQGFTVFCISWRNPGSELRDMGMDDYRRLGVMAALDAVETVCPGHKTHAVGYCLGGTLLSIAAAAMARDGDERLASVSLFAAQVDFEEPGELGLFIDESQVSFLEDIMWRQGYLDQRQMAGTFQMLRSQDLIWSRIVREYLLGDRDGMSDLMAWNADPTRMPYRMHSQYLRQLFLKNDLAQGRFKVGDEPVHLEDVHTPVFAVGTEKDHVAPWHSVFKLIHLFDTDVDFVLTSGGHNAGIVSEPGHRHRSFRRLEYRHGQVHPDPDQWSANAPVEEGSWWPVWAEWLARHSSDDVAPPPMGHAPYEPLCPAPGTYVLEH
ncbi:MAG: alpha/beta fold hydrolase [Salaquimonas sp.]|nr:alpha/beta fold hydrolase [Salaquimonas sp.]